MDNIKKVELPDGLMPDEHLYKNAKKIDNNYNDMFINLRKLAPDAKAVEIIAIMAQYFAERLALLVGDNINDYDKNILRGVLERHIISVVFIEK